jgi:PAS domain S-box-containing protein
MNARAHADSYDQYICATPVRVGASTSKGGEAPKLAMMSPTVMTTTEPDQSASEETLALRDQVETLQREVDRRAEIEHGLDQQIEVQARKIVETNELFRLLVQSVKDYAIFMLEPDGRVATWNAGAERLKGYTAEEIIGRHFSVFYPGGDARAGRCEHGLEVATREGRFEDEGWRVRKDGTRFWASVIITAVRDGRGALVGFAKVTRDLTERKRADEVRRSVEERFRLLVESVKDYAIFILDPSGRVATWNTGAERIKGYRASEIIGSHFSRFYPEADIRAGKCDMELEVAAREGRFEDEGWRLRKDGSRFWANVVISAIRDAAGTLVGFSKVTRDLTDRKRAEEERAARFAAEQANRTKDEFLAVLGHELRNPLAPVVTALQLIKQRGDTSSAREHQVIERQVEHLMHLVDDLLDVSRIAHGKIELKQRPLDLRDALGRAIEIATPLFEGKGHHLAVTVSPRPLGMIGDEARLIQVLTNLLNNAAKYTPPGGHIEVIAGGTDARVSVEVRDDGIGIEPALLPSVFELFVQGDQGRERAAGGLGLGLTLVRSLVRLHGGEVEAHSGGLGQGASFIVRLPAVPLLSEAPAGAAPPEEAPAPAPVPAKRRILLVDDNEDARWMLAEMLGELGYEVESVGDGPAALEVLGAFQPDVAVLDIGLPGMDGYELAERIRQTADGERVRLLALSGYGSAADQARSREAGFDLHLVKPVDVKQLLKHIGEPA